MGVERVGIILWKATSKPGGGGCQESYVGHASE